MNTLPSGYALIIDDEFNNREFAETLLQKAGFATLSAATGAEAVELATARPNMILALIDHQLPDTLGVFLIKQLKAYHPQALLIMATSNDRSELVEEAFEVGADLFIVKPYGFIELYKRLQMFRTTGLLDRTPMIIDQHGLRPYRGFIPVKARLTDDELD